MSWENIFWTVVIATAAWVTEFIVRRLIKLSLKRLPNQRAQTIASVFKNLAKFAIWGIAIATILARFGVDISPFLTGAGVLGVAIAFGSQALVKDLVSGMFMIMENYVAVGDLVEVAGKKGKVVSVKLRTIIIRDEENKQVHIIPYSSVGVITKWEK